MRAGDPPTFKRGAPSSAAVRQQGALGAQKPARRGAAASVTQGRNGAAGANAFLPPQLKGRCSSLDAFTGPQVLLIKSWVTLMQCLLVSLIEEQGDPFRYLIDPQ